MNIHGVPSLTVILALALTTLAWQEPAPAAQSSADDAAVTSGYRAESSGKVLIGEQQIRYRALVEETFITGDDGQRTASLVSTSYIRTDVAAGATRPVVFAFNGGPGSAGLWLQLGLVGPRRVQFDDVLRPPTVPPYRLVDNAESILDVADLVIFDPPGTGFSRVLEAGKPEQFFGVTQDARTTVQFIHDWVRHHARWNSPRFLMAESYGTIRAAVVSRLLAGGPFGTGSMEALTLNGVILLGQAMDHSDGAIALANDLPSLAATAWFHDKVDRSGRTLEQHIAAAREFAATEYLQALYAGTRLPEQRMLDVAERMSKLIGLSVPKIVEHQLRVSTDVFARELLGDDGKQVGKYDSRFVLPGTASGNDPVADDPAMAQYVPAFVAGLNLHVRDELGVDLDRPYLAIEFARVNSHWDYGLGPGVPSRSDYAQDLAIAMRRNPALRLFVGTGYYDLVTTVGDAEYTLAHADFPLERITAQNYESGHMPYLGAESRRQLAADLRQFIARASRP